MTEIDLKYDEAWSEGPSASLTLYNPNADKWLLFKVKGNEMAVKGTSVTPCKGIVGPKKSVSVIFSTRKKQMPPHGETKKMNFLVKWALKDFDIEPGTFKNLMSFERIDLVCRRDIAYTNLGDQRVENLVDDVVMVKLEQHEPSFYVKETLKVGSSEIQNTRKPPRKITLLTKLKILSFFIGLYVFYSLVWSLFDYLSSFHDEVMNLNPWTFFPWN